MRGAAATADASLAGGPAGALPLAGQVQRQEALLRVYVQHVISAGSGALGALSAEAPAVLLRVVHSP